MRDRELLAAWRAAFGSNPVRGAARTS